MAGVVCLVVLVGLEGTLIGLGADAAALYPRWGKTDSKVKSMAVRLNYWRGAEDLFAEHPIAGVGPGQFGKAYLAVKPVFAAEEVAHCHNWLLNIAAEWGVLGLLGMIVAIGVPGWQILKGLGERDSRSGDSVVPDGTGRDESEGQEKSGVAGSQDLRPGLLSDAPAGLTTEQRVALASSSDGCDASGRGLTAALLPAVGVVLVCGLIYLPGIVGAGAAVLDYMSVPLRWMLAVAMVASLSPLLGRGAVAVLFGGLVAFFVHSTVEISAGVAAAMWPAWGLLAVALAMVADHGGGLGLGIGDRGPETGTAAVGGPAASGSKAEGLVRGFGAQIAGRRTSAGAAGSSGSYLVLIGCVAAGFVAIWLSVTPLRSIVAMGRARAAMWEIGQLKTQGAAVVGGQAREIALFEQAWSRLEDAARIDPVDPGPCESLGVVCQRAATADAGHKRLWLTRAAAACDEAVARDPGDNVLWSDAAGSHARLAAVTGGRAEMDKAVEAMQRAVELYPRWPRGRLWLAGMLATASGMGDGRPELARRAVQEMDAALQLNAGWPAEDARRFSDKEIAEIKARRAAMQRQRGRQGDWETRRERGKQ